VKQLLRAINKSYGPGSSSQKAGQVCPIDQDEALAHFHIVRHI
jgi:hypothetical protein